MNSFEDNYRQRGMRRKLIEDLRDKLERAAERGDMVGPDRGVLEAMMNVPRHVFLDRAFLEYAYRDTAFQIGAGQTISQPYTVAYMSVLLQVEKGMKVLEIGTGSGYQACILAELGARVYTIERQKELFEQVKERLPRMGYRRIKCFYGDGYQGLPAWAPFDRIIITAAAPHIPEALVEQLAPGGRLVLPLTVYGDRDDEKSASQIMVLLQKDETGAVRRTNGAAFRFVPMLPGRTR